MSQPPPPLPPSEADDLQFNTAEPTAETETTGPVVCSACGKPVDDSYYAAGDNVVCPSCRDAFLASHTGGSRMGRLLRATLFGFVAGIGGAVIWYAVRRLTGYEVGLIAIVVGLMVGGAVRAGSRGRGGVGYQVLAVLLTYFSICANYMPDIFFALQDQFRQEQFADAGTTQPAGATTAPASAPTRSDDVEAAMPVAGAAAADEELSAGQKALGLTVVLVFMFAISLAAPFLGGAGNIIGLLIIAFALWEAWKINKRREVNLTGPYQLATGAGGADSAAAPPDEQ